MNIAICGSAAGADKEILEKTARIGRTLASHRITILSGGCGGYPDAAVKGALSIKGDVVCYSPGKTKQDHVESYRFPFDEGAEYVYTGEGIPGRNLTLVKNADAVVIVGGQSGTLNEFTLAFTMGKPLYVLQGSGGIVGMLPKIVEICKRSREEVTYFQTSRELISLLKQ